MKLSAAVFALLLANASQAAVIATAETEDPLASMRFTDEKGPCLGNARKAEFAKIGEEVVVGCWVVRSGGFLSIAWLDGDQDKVPLHLLNHEVL